MALQNFSFTKSGNKHIPNKTILAIISPTLNFIFRRFELHKFKKLLKSDLKSYKKDCKKNYD